MYFTKSDPGLVLKYQTDLKLEQMDALRKEVADIWVDFEKEATKANVNGAAIIAGETPTGWPIYRNKTYGFAYTKQLNGTWTEVPSSSK